MRDTISTLYEYDEPITSYPATDEIEIPAWIEQDITPSIVAAILQGRCASGAYMPAVTAHEAVATMSAYGSEVYDFMDGFGESPRIPPGSSWAEIAELSLSLAVELWAAGISEQLADALAGEDR